MIEKVTQPYPSHLHKKKHGHKHHSNAVVPTDASAIGSEMDSRTMADDLTMEDISEMSFFLEWQKHTIYNCHSGKAESK